MSQGETGRTLDTKDGCFSVLSGSQSRQTRHDLGPSEGGTSTSARKEVTFGKRSCLWREYHRCVALNSISVPPYVLVFCFFPFIGFFLAQWSTWSVVWR